MLVGLTLKLFAMKMFEGVGVQLRSPPSGSLL